MTHVTTLWKAIVLSFIINYYATDGATTFQSADDSTPAVAALASNPTDGDWDAEAQEEFMPTFYHTKKLFNEGKPFFVEKDPVSGQLDFNHKKSAGVENYKTPTDDLIPLRTNEIAPNIHDFLHLPVKYSSSKSVYPLVSSSYSNLKYQGSNKNSENNHKEYNDIHKRPNFFTNNAIFPFEKTPSPELKTTPVSSSTTTVTTPAPRPTVNNILSTTRRPYLSQYHITTTRRTTTRRTTPVSTSPSTVPTTPSPTTTLRTTYTPTVPTTDSTKFRPVTTTTMAASTPSTAASVSTSPITTDYSTQTTTSAKPPVAFPTESMSLSEMLNSFAEDSNRQTINTIHINENAQPFRPPSGFKLNKEEPPKTMPPQNFNEYVKYDIQPPNMVSFHSHEPVSSMNNIKISPDQNVATFVLGSKQSVGDGPNQHQFNVVPNQPPKVVGQVFNEPISSGSASIRFPTKNEDKNRFENMNGITPNGHSAPFGLDANKRLVFPPPYATGVVTNGHDSKQVGTKIVFENEDQVTGDTQQSIYPTHEVLPLKSNPNQWPIGTESETGHRNRPQYFGNEFPDRIKTQQQSPPPRPPPHLMDPSLPNILPQFRPNTKVGHGQHSYKDAGVFRPPYPNVNRRIYPGPGAFPPKKHFGPQPPRINYQPNRFLSKMAPAPPTPPSKEKIEANRRQYKLTHTQALYAVPPRMNPQSQASDRVFNVRPQFPENGQNRPLNNDDKGGPFEPNTLKNNFIDDYLYKSPPQQELQQQSDHKMEPVVTLQMIQTKKLNQGPAISAKQPPLLESGLPTPPSVVLGNTEKPVYVVYPLKNAHSELDHPVVVGQRGENSPLPPSEISSDAYHNTPFTVQHHEQKPILTTLQKQHLSVPKPNKTSFPYHLEQPDPNVASELDTKNRRKDNYYPLGQLDSIYNIGEQPVAPKILNSQDRGDIVSTTLTKVTDRPIAIAYTPTQKPIQLSNHRPQGSYFSMPNYDSAVIPEILEGIEPINKHDELEFANIGHYEKDFQAPFHPSVNLGHISDTYHGWSILGTTERPQFVEQKNNINRGDVNKDELIVGDYNSEKEGLNTFTSEGFQPELQGGFRPIFPPGMSDQRNKIQGSDEEEHDIRDENREDRPFAEKQVLVEIQPLEEEEEDQEDEVFDGQEEEHGKEDIHGKESQAVLSVAQQTTKQHEVVASTTVESVVVVKPSNVEKNDFQTTTEKVMSFEDALSAIFGFGEEESSTGEMPMFADDVENELTASEGYDASTSKSSS